MGTLKVPYIKALDHLIGTQKWVTEVKKVHVASLPIIALTDSQYLYFTLSHRFHMDSIWTPSEKTSTHNFV